MKLAWVTDLHLNLAPTLVALLAELRTCGADALLVGGDTDEGPHLPSKLRLLQATTGLPVYFVLGNHDFYRSTIANVHSNARELCSENQQLIWLSESDFITLTNEVVLIGHDGWADGRYGDYHRYGVRLNDHRLIGDFMGRDSEERLSLMQALAEESASHIDRVLPTALESARRVLLLTHVPPFAEATWHEGNVSGPDYLPHFSNKILGDVILRHANAAQDKEIIVFCGHCHSSGYCQPIPNVHVFTAGAKYGQPRVEATFDPDQIDPASRKLG